MCSLCAEHTFEFKCCWLWEQRMAYAFSFIKWLFLGCNIKRSWDCIVRARGFSLEPALYSVIGFTPRVISFPSFTCCSLLRCWVSQARLHHKPRIKRLEPRWVSDTFGGFIFQTENCGIAHIRSCRAVVKSEEKARDMWEWGMQCLAAYVTGQVRSGAPS